MTNKLGIIRKIKDRETANDVVYTPISLAKLLIEMADIQPTDRVLDPCRGEGIFFQNLPLCEAEWCEVTEGRDFFQFHEPVDVIIGNPPFSLWKKWLEHSVKLTPRKICYVMGILNLTSKRVDFLKKHGYFLSKLHITSVRGWFANTLCVVFDREGTDCITYDIERR